MNVSVARWLCAAALLWTTAALAGEGLVPKRSPQADFLPVDQAFELQPLEWRDGKLIVAWRIAPDYYLYRNRFKFMLAEPAGAKLGEPKLPLGIQHEDEFFGKTEVYRGDLQAELPFEGKSRSVKLTVVYQGCADAGLCYPPQTRALEARR